MRNRRPANPVAGELHRLIVAVAALIVAVPLAAAAAAADSADARVDRRVAGMLLGAAIGDAVGGPVEFVPEERLGGVLPRFRRQPETRLTPDDLRRLGRSTPLLGYARFRPAPEPYAHWSADAPAGTVTDDTRHKMILLAAFREAARDDAWPVDRRAIATALLRFGERPEVRDRPGWSALSESWLREVSYAARWERGDRDPRRALPPARVWGGIGTCCGQMMLLPVAGVYPGDPERAYLAAYELGLLDNGDARDLNSAIVAGLAHALARPAPGPGAEARLAAWRDLLGAMTRTDPLRYGQIEFMDRAVDRWVRVAREVAQRADGSPATLYRLIAEACPHRYGWEADYLFVAAAAIVEFSGADPLAAMHLCLDYGADTDSVAQLVGAWFGAIDGPGAFPAAMRDAVAQRLAEDYGESPDEWARVLAAARQRERSGAPSVRPLLGKAAAP